MSTTTQAPISQLYKWSAWLHIGPGAEKCEAVNEEQGVNDCSNPLHFHAFCRLPNPFDHREIREAALAAKARRVRLLRDPDSDAAAILEDEIARLAREGDLAKESIVDELLQQDWWRDFLEATAEIREMEDESGSQIFEHIERDVAKYQREAGDTDEDQLSEELAALRAHITRYNDLIDKRREELTEPRKQALEQRDINSLLDMVRDLRIDADSNEHFSHEYSALQWLAGTFRTPGGEPMFPSREVMQRADTAIVEGLQETFNDLAKTQQRGGGPGNS